MRANRTYSMQICEISVTQVCFDCICIYISLSRKENKDPASPSFRSVSMFFLNFRWLRCFAPIYKFTWPSAPERQEKGGGGYSLEWTILEGSVRKEFLSQASSVLNGGDFTRWGIWKGREIGDWVNWTNNVFLVNISSVPNFTSRV